MEITLRFVFVLLKILSWISAPVFWILSKRNGKKVPPIKNNILFLSATQISEQIRKRQIKCEDVVKAYVERVGEVNPIINAVVEDRFADAIADAKAIDEYLCSEGIDEDVLKISRPLLGVPFTVKESCKLKGLSFVVGSKLRKDLKAEDDGDVVRLMRNAGAIPLLVSNTPEYSMFWECNNLITGCTKNPYNTNYSCAGSSGGEGALLGSGASLIGLGSDLAGSIRLPALFNGIFGHKPTASIVSPEGHFPNSTNAKVREYLTIGHMTRYAEDLPLIFKVIAQNQAERLKLGENVDLKNLKLFWMDCIESSLVLIAVEDEIKELIGKAVGHLQSCGCQISDCKFDLENSCEMSSSVFFSLQGIPKLLHNPMKGKESDHLPIEFCKSIFGLSKYSRNALIFTSIQYCNGFVPKSNAAKYESLLNILRKDFLDKLGENGVFIFPTFPTTAFLHNEFLIKSSGVVYLSIFNLLGFPSTHLPMGLNKNGLPIGLQIVAAPHEDRLCFAVAKEIETAFGGWVPPNK